MMFRTKSKINGIHFYFRVIALAFSIFLSGIEAFAGAPTTLNFQARLRTASGVAVENTDVTFLFEYTSAVSSNCVLYQETYANINMSGSAGIVSLQLGQPAKRDWSATGTSTLADIFRNSGTFTCQDSSTYTPGSQDIRYLRIKFQYPGSGGWNEVAGIKINSVPYAMHASYAASADNSTLFGGRPVSDFVLNPVGAIAGQVLKWNGSSWIASADNSGAAGGVTDITAGTGLTGGFINSGGQTIAVDVGTTANKIPQLDGSGKLPFSVIPNSILNTVTAFSGDVTGAYNLTSVTKIRGVLVDSAASAPAAGDVLQFDGTKYVATAIPSAPVASVAGKTGVVTLTSADITGLGTAAGMNVGTAAGTVAAGNDARFTDSRAPIGTASGDLSGTYPNPGVIKIRGVPVDVAAATPASGDVLRFDGAKYIATALPSAPVTSVAGKTGVVNLVSSDITGLGTAAGMNVGTAAGTVAAGNDARFTDARAPSGAASGDLSGTYPNPSVAKIQGVNLNITALASGNFLKYNGTNWVNVTPAISDITNLTTQLSNKLDQSNMPASCGAGQTLTFSSPTGTWSCSNIVLALNNGKILIGNGSNVAAEQSVSGDATLAANGQLTLANTVTAGTGTKLTFDSKGRIIASGNLSSADISGFVGTNFAKSTVAPTVTEDAKSLRWNNTTGQWEWFTAGVAGAGITSLNGESGSAQNFAVNNGGTFGFTSASNIHTLNIPSANGATTGLLSSADYTTFAGKLNASAAFSGDVTGTYNLTSVTKIRGVAVDVAAATPTSGDVLRYDGTKYIATALPSAPVASVAGKTGVVTLTSADITGLGAAAGLNVGTIAGTVAAGNDARFTDARAPSGAASGDLSGTYPNPGVIKIRGVLVDVAAATPTSGDVLRYDGTKYIATALPSAPVTSVAGKTGVVTLTSADVTGFGTLAGKSSVTLTTDVTGTLPIANGGTGATTAAAARTALGLGTSATVDTGSAAGNIPLLSTGGLVANKMCVADGTAAGIVCNTNIPTSSQWITTGSDIHFSTGNVGIGTAGAPGAALDIRSPATTTVGVEVRGANGQTSNLQSWKSFANSVLAYISAAGDFVISTGNLVISSQNATDGAACTTVGSISRDVNGDLFLCK